MTVRGRTQDDQQALPLVFRVFQANVDVDPIRPEVDILLAREIAAIPLLVLRRPSLLEPNDHIRTESLGLFAQERLQGLREISRGNSPKVEPGNELLDGLAAPEVRRQDRRTELHPRVLTRRIVAHPRLLYLQGPGTGHDLAVRLVTVADDQTLAVLVTPLVVLVEKVLHLGLDGLLEHLLSTPAHQLIEQIASLKLLPEVGDFQIDLDNPWQSAVESRSLDHGVSFQPSLGQLMKRNSFHQQDTPPFSFQLEHTF